MPILNSTLGYGALTKLFHWLIVLLFASQYLSATIMLRTPPEATTLGLDQATYYNWHKSLGLVALAVSIARLLNRGTGTLPPWAPTLTSLEQTIIHRAEQLLYAAMFIMPVSGFLYVMAGGYGVRLFGIVDLPNPVPSSPVLASTANWVHVAGSMLLLLPLGTHLGLVLGHHFGLKDRLMHRMLPVRPAESDR
ncbi:MAG TPA: cytochrome b/b6 domain-containing protein [Hyphomicrobiaceae bacterium]|jgi:cytochrome b561